MDRQVCLICESNNFVLYVYWGCCLILQGLENFKQLVISFIVPWWFLNALFLTYNVLFITCYFSIRNVIRWDTFLVLLKRDHFICIQLLKRAFSFKIICCYFNIIRDMKPSWMKCGWNDRSCSFPMISVIPLDPLAGGKVFFLKNDALKRADQCWLLLLQK